MIIILMSVIICVLGCTETRIEEDTADLQIKSPDNSDQQDEINLQKTQPSKPISNKNTPASIIEFASAEEGELIRFYFLLQDSAGKRISANGKVKFKILDNSDNLLYEDSFDIASSDYEDYYLQLTGQYMGKAYEWRVPENKIKKGMSNFGKAEIIFESNEKELSATNELVSIPSYSEEEIQKINEDEYKKSKLTLEKTITKGNFRITVNSFGFYKSQGFFSTEEVFRIDLIAENIGSESDYFTPTISIIDSNRNQYDATYGGTLDLLKNMYPDTIQEGYAILEGVPKNIKSGKLIFELGYDGDFEPYIFEYQLSMVS